METMNPMFTREIQFGHLESTASFHIAKRQGSSRLQLWLSCHCCIDHLTSLMEPECLQLALKGSRNSLEACPVERQRNADHAQWPTLFRGQEERDKSNIYLCYFSFFEMLSQALSHRKWVGETENKVIAGSLNRCLQLPGLRHNKSRNQKHLPGLSHGWSGPSP